MRRSLLVVGVFAGLLLCGVGHASQVSFRPLEEVIANTPLVFDAEIVKATRSNTKQQMKMTWELKGLHALRGALPSGTTATYTEIIPIMYDDKGNVVGSFSPILEASGEEWNAKAGRWIFLSSGIVQSDGLLVRRIEPMSRLQTVEALIAKSPDAGVAVVTPAPTTSGAAPTSSAAPSASSEPGPPPSVRPSRGCGCDVGGERADLGFAIVVLGVAMAITRRRRGDA